MVSHLQAPVMCSLYPGLEAPTPFITQLKSIRLLRFTRQQLVLVSNDEIFFHEMIHGMIIPGFTSLWDDTGNGMGWSGNWRKLDETGGNGMIDTSGLLTPSSTGENQHGIRMAVHAPCSDFHGPTVYFRRSNSQLQWINASSSKNQCNSYVYDMCAVQML